jgi:hypothetical protein
MDSFMADEKLADLEGLLMKFVMLERQLGYLSGMVHCNIAYIGSVINVNNIFL